MSGLDGRPVPSDQATRCGELGPSRPTASTTGCLFVWLVRASMKRLGNMAAPREFSYQFANLRLRERVPGAKISSESATALGDFEAGEIGRADDRFAQSVLLIVKQVQTCGFDARRQRATSLPSRKRRFAGRKAGATVYPPFQPVLRCLARHSSSSLLSESICACISSARFRS